MSQPGVERVDGVPIVRLVDDLDAANAGQVRQLLDGALAPDASGLVADLSEVRYLDSAGIDMLLRLADRLDQRRAKLILVVPDTSQLKRLLAIVGLPDAVAVHPTLAEAVEAAKAASAPAAAPHLPPNGAPTAG